MREEDEDDEESNNKCDKKALLCEKSHENITFNVISIKRF